MKKEEKKTRHDSKRLKNNTKSTVCEGNNIETESPGNL